MDRVSPFALLEDVFEQQTRTEFVATFEYLETHIQYLMNVSRLFAIGVILFVWFFVLNPLLM